MAINRYVKDYRLVETVDERGRIKTEYEYIGSRYEYVSDRPTLMKNRRIIVALCCVSWFIFIAALVPFSASMRKIYISMPFLFSALPLGILTEVLISAPVHGKPIERRQAERLSNRWPAAAFFMMLLDGISFLGAVVSILAGMEYQSGDGYFLVFAAVLTACGIILFIKRRSFDTRKA